MDFYHELAPYYDQMINFDERLGNEQIIFQTILDKYPAETALDAGCGSGFHSIVLSRLGLKVTGIDTSEDMLNLARANALKYQTRSHFLQADFLTAAECVSGRFDSVFCLGNGFVHLLNTAQQLQAMLNFRSLLAENGYLCLQIINYDKFLQEKKEKLSVKRTDDTTFTRTYEYLARTISFHVQVEKNGRVQTFSTELYPLLSSELSRLIEEAGFSRIKVYGSLEFEPFEPLISNNCCFFCDNKRS